MGNSINESGTKLEKKLEVYLIENKIQYKKQKSSKHEIDFIIQQPDAPWYVECTNQNSKGSVAEKIPHKVRKYHRLYGFKKVYNVIGEYKIPNEVIITMDEDAETYGYEYTLDTFDEFVSRLDGSYNYSPLGI
tara:strand:- start:663 stop:1061 length:399 start_codon:yes stop_codon:yes gene_type:complete